MTDIKNAIEREKEEADSYQTEYDNNVKNPMVSKEWREGLADEAEYHQQIAEWLEDYSHIKSAWEEVLHELEKENTFWTKQAFKHKDNEFAEGKAFGLSKAIDIIKQKLAEIEEGEEYGICTL